MIAHFLLEEMKYCTTYFLKVMLIVNVIRESLTSNPLSKARVCLSCYLCVDVFVDAGGHDPGTEPPSVDPKTGTSHRIGNSPQTIGKVDFGRRKRMDK